MAHAQPSGKAQQAEPDATEAFCKAASKSVKRKGPKPALTDAQVACAIERLKLENANGVQSHKIVGLFCEIAKQVSGKTISNPTARRICEEHNLFDIGFKIDNNKLLQLAKVKNNRILNVSEVHRRYNELYKTDFTYAQISKACKFLQTRMNPATKDPVVKPAKKGSNS